MMAPRGRLLGLGVGPGDPELITLKALRLLREAPVVGYFVAKASVATPSVSSRHTCSPSRPCCHWSTRLPPKPCQRRCPMNR